MEISSATEQILAEFKLELDALKKISSDFKRAMNRGLQGQNSSLKMLPSFLGLPTGTEKGNALAIDFGGTNVRIMGVTLDGARGAHVSGLKRFSLVDRAAGYDYTSETVKGHDLFRFIAQRLGDLVVPNQNQRLGCTFSFPCTQTGVNSARLIKWTKEFRTREMEGRDIGELLTATLLEQSFGSVKVAAIINDTVGTLLSAGYQRSSVDIGAICGTGHNTCYLEPKHPLTGAPMIVNIESGNFDEVPQNRFDKVLDETSTNPSLQKLEKMVSGRYLGEVIRHVLIVLSQEGILPSSNRLAEPQVITGADIDCIIMDADQLEAIGDILHERLAVEVSAEQRKAIQAIVRGIAERSARIAAAALAGVVLHIDPELKREHVIAVDGSLYEKMPDYAAKLLNALKEILGPGARVEIMLAKDGSGLGVAVAAIMADPSKKTSDQARRHCVSPYRSTRAGARRYL